MAARARSPFQAVRLTKCYLVIIRRPSSAAKLRPPEWWRADCKHRQDISIPKASSPQTNKPVHFAAIGTDYTFAKQRIVVLFILATITVASASLLSASTAFAM
jgi:hypothetical protein